MRRLQSDAGVARISSGTHRKLARPPRPLHGQGTTRPQVARHPDQRRVVDNFEIPMRRRLGVGRRPRPDHLRAAAVAMALGRGRGRTRRHRVRPRRAPGAWRAVFPVALGLLTLTEIVHVVGLWQASTASFGTKLGESAYSFAGIALGLLALGWIWRKGVESAVPLVLVATIFLFVAGGLADVTTLGNSQVPSTLLARGRAAPGHAHAGARRRARGRGRVPPASTTRQGTERSGTPPNRRHQLSSAHPAWSSGSTWIVACAMSCSRRSARGLVEHTVRVGRGSRPSRATSPRPSPT